MNDREKEKREEKRERVQSLDCYQLKKKALEQNSVLKICAILSQLPPVETCDNWCERWWNAHPEKYRL